MGADTECEAKTGLQPSAVFPYTMDGPGSSPARLLELLSAPLRCPEWFPAEQGVVSQCKGGAGGSGCPQPHLGSSAFAGLLLAPSVCVSLREEMSLPGPGALLCVLLVFMCPPCGTHLLFSVAEICIWSSATSASLFPVCKSCIFFSSLKLSKASVWDAVTCL